MYDVRTGVSAYSSRFSESICMHDGYALFVHPWLSSSCTESTSTEKMYACIADLSLRALEVKAHWIRCRESVCMHCVQVHLASFRGIQLAGTA